jgi:hypothetical protein
MVIFNSLNLQLPLCIYEYFFCRDEIHEITVTMADPFVAIAR